MRINIARFNQICTYASVTVAFSLRTSLFYARNLTYESYEAWDHDHAYVNVYVTRASRMHAVFSSQNQCIIAITIIIITTSVESGDSA